MGPHRREYLAIAVVIVVVLVVVLQVFQGGHISAILSVVGTAAP